MLVLLFLLFSLTECYYLDSNLNKIMRTKRENGLSCPREGTPCVTPLKYADTERFKCDNTCPFGYKCCPDTCFQHKICKKSENSNSLGFCPQDKNLCLAPLSCEKTKQFSCFTDNECPSGYVCCKDSCFVHKICKEKVSIVTTPLPTTEVQEETTTTEKTPVPTTTEAEEETTFATTEQEDEETTPVPTTTEAEEQTTFVTTEKEDEETTPVATTTEAEEQTTFVTTEKEEETSPIPTPTAEETTTNFVTTGSEDNETSSVFTTTEEGEASPISTTTEEEYVEEYYDETEE